MRHVVKTLLALALIVFFAAPGVASANNPAATAAGLAIDAVVVGLQAAIAADQAAVGGKPGTAAANVAEKTGEKIIDPIFATVVREVFWNTITFVTDRLAYDAAVALSSAGTGQTPLVHFDSPKDYWEQLGMDVLGEAIGSLDNLLGEELDLKFNLCAPQDPLSKLSLQIGLAGDYGLNRQGKTAPKCNFRNFLSNINAIGARYTGEEFGTQSILRQFANAWEPGQNELSASIAINLGIRQEVLTTKQLGVEELFAKDGFKDVVDVITGKVTTPSALIKLQTETAIVLSKNEYTKDLTIGYLTGSDPAVLKQMGLSAISVFANTLLSGLANRLYQGIFNPPATRFDPLHPQAATEGGRQRAQETFRSILSASVISFDDYNIVNEFVICPGDDLRGLNNCVMDQGFATAVTRGGDASSALTVQKAIDGGYLKGGWPLIPSSDEGRNQDVRCSTYGYCYANLVKMRKARILPVGWELAADSPWNDEASPVTLQTVVDGFFNCNDEGQADDAHPWCHLIDPNWILKIPPAQCRAFVPSELPVSSLVNARQSVCVDSPSCIAQNDAGECIGGYGYCTQESNTWQFRGDRCPSEYAGCLSFNNVRTSESGSYLLNTVNTDGCNAENSGCRWYRTNKYEDDKGTPELTDDAFEFLPVGETYVTTDWDAADDAFEDRLYMNQNVGVCNADFAGCTELISAGATRLNLLRNPSFEEDKDEDGTPDGWSIVGASAYDTAGAEGFDGIDSISSVSSGFLVSQGNIPFSPSRFYTLSYYVKDTASTAGTVLIELAPEDPANTVDLAGMTILGDCSAGGDTAGITMTAGSLEDAYERKICTITTPGFETRALISATSGVGGMFLDAFQLELGSVAGTFQSGYGSGLVTREYLTVPPAWMGCTGAASDPVECASYTRVCSAQDVGCDLYTPTAGGFGVPAVTSSADLCPNECVGYETYKQEATAYEAEDFPLFFIADSARACSQAEVGCDAYTNLNEVALGGEGIEYYSTLRSCATSDQDDGSTFYTWEGTEDEGFQLRSWQLLESNLNDARDTVYVEETTTVFTELGVGLAPCTNSVVTSEASVACQDVVRSTTETDTYADCNEHADAISNPDCREFYDSSGDIHYRLLSQTAVISDSCAPYRKDGGTQNDCTNSGGFWTSGGSCRYFVLSEESVQCSESAAGCRAYTGASGRNASTIFTDTIEDGALNEYTSASPATISNESVSAGGHSLRVVGSGVTMLSLLEGSATITAGDTNTDGQCDAGELCTLREGAAGSICQVAGTDTDHVDDCGPLVGSLVQGKTYILEFWAKGVGVVTPQFVANRGVAGATVWNLGDASATPPTHAVTLAGGWQRYSVGPLDTSDAALFADFDDTAVLRFSATGSPDYFIDNIVLKETEENLALIKNSWVTPSTCDLSPTGTPSPQHYLGCQEYTDGAGSAQNLYQFTRLCREEVIGCSAYFDTQNSESVFGQVFNATCSRPIGSVPPLGAQDCTMDGETVCTIASGRSTCHFDFDGALPSPLPATPFVISLGPEARLVSGDSDVFLVNKGDTSCGAVSAGCTEVGLPTFNQNKSAVTDFETTYLLDDPDRYTTTLCDTEGLFCEAWSTRSDGTFYFKDPSDQTCEFKPSVTINGQNYSGWFRSGANAPCYYDDLPDANGDLNGVFDPATELSTAYLISGIEFGIWRNGDADDYQGWLATCPNRYDRCSEFVDPMDTTGGLYPNGTPYVYIKNQKIEESELSSSERCNGQVNLNEGCALFFDAVQPELLWSASASYIVSEHADILKGDAAQSSQSPISCLGSVADDPITATDENNDIGRILSPSGVEFNVCQSRCRYEPEEDGVIEHPYAQRLTGGTTYTTSCVQRLDCPTLKDSNNKSVAGTCVQAYDDTPEGLQAEHDPVLWKYVLNFDDVNDVRRVARDRECSEWLTCSSTIQVWDERLGRFREICDQIGACTQYSQVGDVNICSGFSAVPALPLSSSRYVDRDVSWWGQEYSGYAIPGNIPTQLLDQVNINHAYACSLQTNIACSLATSESDCENLGLGVCTAYDEDIRLAYNAGTCISDDLATGSACYVGTCEDSGFACSNNDECDTSTGEACEIGFCENTQIGVSCSDANPCAAPFTCQSGLCKQETGTACSPNVSGVCATGSPSVSGQCILQETSFKGGCFANTCLLSADGEVFVPGFTNAVECKAYPEQNSPYPHRVEGGENTGVPVSTGIVTQWVNPSSNAVIPDADLQTVLESGPPPALEDLQDWNVYTKRPGYQGIQACAPNGEDCSCTYQKVTYGTGIKMKYYGRDVDSGAFLTGVCLGGELEGMECETDGACNAEEGVAIGRCVKPTSVETMLGVDGYCLERDTAINKWKDPNATFGGECLTWLPVDQLTGSNDIYNSFTEAGALLDQDALYCTSVNLYVDLLSTGSQNPGGESNPIDLACAESKRGSVNASPGPENNRCDAGQRDSCEDNAHCPRGYFALLSTCEDPSLDPSEQCVQGSTTGGADDDCPYFCVPEDARDPFEGDSAQALSRCAEPTGVSGVGDTNSDSSVGWSTTVYTVPEMDGYPNGDYDNWRQRYQVCARRGLTEDDSSYEKVTPASSRNANTGYRHLGQSDGIQPYLACDGLALVSDPTGVYGSGGNKAWTDRLWETAPPRYALTEPSSSSILPLLYDASTTPDAPAGRVFGGVMEFVNGLRLTNEAVPGGDQFPIPVAACDDLIGSLYTADEDQSCTVFGGTLTDYVPASPYGDVNGFLARAYEPIVVDNAFDLPPAGSAECDTDTDCAVAEGIVCSTPASPGDCRVECDDGGTDGDCTLDLNNDGDTNDVNENLGVCQYHELADKSYCSLSLTFGSEDFCLNTGVTIRNVLFPSLEPDDLVDDGVGVCSSGDFSGQTCTARYQCASTVCTDFPSGGFCVEEGYESPEPPPVGNAYTNTDAFNERLAQFFAKVFKFFSFAPVGGEDALGHYDELSTGATDKSENPDVIPGPDDGGTAPIVRGLDDCFSNGCREAGDDTVTVNGVTGGTILGDFGAAHVSVQFFAEANANQLPIRNALVNFGDGHQSGSTGPANYYKNRRGLNQNNDDTPFCTQNTKWGETSESCEPNYFTFTHDYVCTTQLVSEGGLPACSDTSADLSDGCRTSDGLCQFIPRVHVKDNWGYCTGECGDNNTPADSACYDNLGGALPPPPVVNECDPKCDGDSGCVASDLLPDQTINPWISFGGVVRVEP